jgi:hypothetical protein
MHVPALPVEIPRPNYYVVGVGGKERQEEKVEEKRSG